MDHSAAVRSSRPTAGSRRVSGGGMQPGPTGPGKRMTRTGGELRRSDGERKDHWVPHVRLRSMAVPNCIWDIHSLHLSSALPFFRRRWRGSSNNSIIRPPRPLGPGYTPRPPARPGLGADTRACVGAAAVREFGHGRIKRPAKATATPHPKLASSYRLPPHILPLRSPPSCKWNSRPPGRAVLSAQHQGGRRAPGRLRSFF